MRFRPVGKPLRQQNSTGLSGAFGWWRFFDLGFGCFACFDTAADDIDVGFNGEKGEGGEGDLAVVSVKSHSGEDGEDGVGEEGGFGGDDSH